MRNNKLILFCLILFVISISLREIFGNSHCSAGVTRFKRSFEEVLSRKKRFLVFPQNGIILLTPSMTKHLISRTPRGVQISIELDVIHPLPDTVDAFRPKIFDQKSVTIKPKPAPPPRFIMMNDIYSFHDHHSEWRPHDGWQSGPFISNISRSVTDNNLYPGDIRRVYSTMMNTPAKSSWRKDYKHKNNPYNSGQLQWGPHKDDTFAWYETNELPKYRNFRRNFQGRNGKSPSLEHEEWRNDRGHRDRRAIYDHFTDLGKAFGIDVKACVMRLICEVQNVLLPPGKSLIQDIVRILFTIPTKPHWEDEYSRAMKSSTQVNCKELYESLCRFSILEYLLNKQTF